MKDFGLCWLWKNGMCEDMLSAIEVRFKGFVSAMCEVLSVYFMCVMEV